MTERRAVRIGTRSSPLAMAQAEATVAALRAIAPDERFELVPTVSKGDRDLRPFAQIDQRGLFAGELEQSLADGEIDAAVHSCKDLRPEEVAGLRIGAYLPRAAAHDVLVGVEGFAQLAAMATPRVATGSARRTSLVLDHFHRLGRAWGVGVELVPIRGNVGSRLAKFAEDADATILARAGIDRLGIDLAALGVPHCDLRERWVGDPGQGAVVVQVRSDDDGFDWHLLDDPDTRLAVEAERRIARVLGGGCERPVGVHVALELLGEVRVSLFAEYVDSDGRPATLHHEIGVGERFDPQSIADAAVATIDAHVLERLHRDAGRYDHTP